MVGVEPTLNTEKINVGGGRGGGIKGAYFIRNL